MDLNLGFLSPGDACPACWITVKGSTKRFWAPCFSQKILAFGLIQRSNQAKLFALRTSAGGESCHHPHLGTSFQAGIKAFSNSSQERAVLQDDNDCTVVGEQARGITPLSA